MAEVSLKGEQRVFMTGNEVIAWAAVAAKVDIMYVGSPSYIRRTKYPT